MGVAIPAATHGWAGGVVYWANRTKGELEKQYPGMQVIVKTAGSAAEQANQVQDLQTVNKINTLVILPFESAPLTQPVAQLKKKGVFVTVVDRGLTDTSAQDAYVAGDNPGFGKVSAEYMAKALGRQGRHRHPARHPDRDRQPARRCLQRRHEEPSRASRCSTPSTATGIATTRSR